MNFEYLSDQDVVKYEPYRPMNLEETSAELTLRIDDEEMIAVELKENHKLIGNVYLCICAAETMKYDDASPMGGISF